MDDFALSVTGPFGSEVIPSGLAAMDLPDTAMFFAMLMSGEQELCPYLEATYNLQIDGALKAALTMLVERARRATDHASVCVDTGRESARRYVVKGLRRSLGSHCAAVELYTAYERWVRAGGAGGGPERPAHARLFLHIVSLHFERVVAPGSVVFRDVAIIPLREALVAETSSAQEEPA